MEKPGDVVGESRGISHLPGCDTRLPSGAFMIPVEKQQAIAEDSKTMGIRELAEKHGISVNTAQKYMRVRGPRNRIRAHFVDGDNGKWVTLENLIVTLEAERKMLAARIFKIDKAIAVLRKLD